MQARFQVVSGNEHAKPSLPRELQARRNHLVFGGWITDRLKAGKQQFEASHQLADGGQKGPPPTITTLPFPSPFDELPSLCLWSSLPLWKRIWLKLTGWFYSW